MIQSKRTRRMIPALALAIIATGAGAFIAKNQGVTVFLFGFSIGILIVIGADIVFSHRNITAAMVANRLHELAQNGADDVLASGIDMGNFAILHLTGGWRIGFVWMNGRLGSVVNAMCDGVTSEDFRNQPMAIYRSKWPDEVQKLQDVIVEAIKRDAHDDNS